MTQFTTADLVRSVQSKEDAMEIISALASAHQVELVPGNTPSFAEPEENWLSARTGRGAVLTEESVKESLAVHEAAYRMIGRTDLADLIDELNVWLVSAVMNDKDNARNATRSLSSEYGTVKEATSAVVDMLPLAGWTAVVTTAPEELDEDLLLGAEEETKKLTEPTTAVKAWEWIGAHHGMGREVVGFRMTIKMPFLSEDLVLNHDPYDGKGSPYEQQHHPRKAPTYEEEMVTEHNKILGWMKNEAAEMGII